MACDQIFGVIWSTSLPEPLVCWCWQIESKASKGDNLVHLHWKNIGKEIRAQCNQAAQAAYWFFVCQWWVWLLVISPRWGKDHRWREDENNEFKVVVAMDKVILQLIDLVMDKRNKAWRVGQHILTEGVKSELLCNRNGLKAWKWWQHIPQHSLQHDTRISLHDDRRQTVSSAVDKQSISICI